MATEDEIRERLCIALRVPLDTPDWLERAEMALHGYYTWRTKQRIKPYDRTTFGGRLLCARETAGITQKQLAARMGVFKCNVWGWEHGTQDFPSEKLGPLCTILLVSVPWMLGESEEGGPNLPTEVLRAAHSPSWLAYVRKRATSRRAYAKSKREFERMRVELEALRNKRDD